MADELFDRINSTIAAQKQPARPASSFSSIGVKAAPAAPLGDPHSEDARNVSLAAKNRFRDIEQEKKGYIDGHPKITVGPDGRTLPADPPAMPAIPATPGQAVGVAASPYDNLPDADLMARMNSALGSPSIPSPTPSTAVGVSPRAQYGLKSSSRAQPGIQQPAADAPSGGSTMIHRNGQAPQQFFAGSAPSHGSAVAPGGVGGSLEQMYQHAMDMANNGGDYSASPVYDSSQAYGTYQGPMVGMNKTGNTALEWSQHAAQIAAAMQGNSVDMAKIGSQNDKVSQFSRMAQMPQAARDMYFAANGWTPEEIKSYGGGIGINPAAAPAAGQAEAHPLEHSKTYVSPPSSRSSDPLFYAAPRSAIGDPNPGRDGQDQFAKDMQMLGYLPGGQQLQSGMFGTPDQLRARLGVKAADY